MRAFFLAAFVVAALLELASAYVSGPAAFSTGLRAAPRQTCSLTGLSMTAKHKKAWKRKFGYPCSTAGDLAIFRTEKAQKSIEEKSVGWVYRPVGEKTAPFVSGEEFHKKVQFGQNNAKVSVARFHNKADK
mmetsp:Transcript_47737/g.95596  ORF Transcript_47737/g.95596 Transcript_47737/m.95596 type:complete len:131 (+) Transcript_47737:25-417(+)